MKKVLTEKRQQRYTSDNKTKTPCAVHVTLRLLEVNNELNDNAKMFVMTDMSEINKN